MSRRRPARPASLDKAAQIRPAATYTEAEVRAAAMGAAQAAQSLVARPLPRPPSLGSLPFGPGVPLVPAPINPVNPVTGRAEPRAYEYPVTFNLPGFGDRVVPWALLRAAANVPLVRRCIEIRKAEVATLDWDVVISPKAIERAQRGTGKARADVEKDLRQRMEPEIGRLVGFWECPDPQNGLDFIGWSSKVLEEYFVLDAIAVYPRLKRSGELFAFDVIDGTTIKPLLDTFGRRPLPPLPAFQQMVYGFPRGEWVADGDVDPQLSLEAQGYYPADRLTYKVHNVRTDTPYGFSAVEQALSDIDLLVRRMQWMKAEYTDGVMPSGFLEAGEGQAEWSPTELAQYETAFNDYLSGSTDARHRFRILPYGMKPAPGGSDLGERYKPEYDLHLIKLVAAHLDTTIAELGFTEMGGLGSTGWHEGQANVQDRKATQPTLRRLQSLCTRLMRLYLGAPPELEFKVLGLEAEDEAAADEIANRRFMSGRMTLNQDLDNRGLPRATFPEADMYLLSTNRGVEPLEGAATRAAQAGAMAPVQEPPKGAQPGQEAPLGVQQQHALAQQQDAEAVKAELVAYRRWLGKAKGTRPFRFEFLSKADALAAGVDLAKAEFAQEVGPSAGPKSAALARVGTGPGGGGALGSGAAGGFDWRRLRENFA